MGLNPVENFPQTVKSNSSNTSSQKVKCLT